MREAAAINGIFQRRKAPPRLPASRGGVAENDGAADEEIVIKKARKTIDILLARCCLPPAKHTPRAR